MNRVHTIRLREPWEREPLATGGIRYHRRFNRPTNLDRDERVWIVCERPLAAAEISLNGTPIGRMIDEHDVTGVLAPANELTIDFAAVRATAELPWGEVRLEIRGS